MYLCNEFPVLYLGRDRDNGSYYFFGNKNGIGRFLKYTTYPMWCGSSHIGNFIDLTAQLPLEIMTEVLLFVNGKTEYEIQPKRQGRAEKIIRRELPNNNIAEATLPEKTSSAPAGPSTKSTEPKPIPPERGSSSTGDGTVSEKKRRASKKRLPEAETKTTSIDGKCSDAQSGSGNGRVGSAPAELQPTAPTEVKRRGRRPATDPNVLVQSGVLRERLGSPDELRILEPQTKSKPRKKV
jgi:hypothetical protein